MSDFLTTLVARSIRPLPAVRPRAPLPFEPARDVPSLNWDRPPEDAAPESSPAQPRATSSPAVSAPVEDVPAPRARPAGEYVARVSLPPTLVPESSLVPPRATSPAPRARPAAEYVARASLPPTPVIDPPRPPISSPPPPGVDAASVPEAVRPVLRPTSAPEPEPKSTGRSAISLPPMPEVRRDAAPPSVVPARSEARGDDPLPPTRARGQEPEDHPVRPRSAAPSRDEADSAAEHHHAPATAPADAILDRLRRWLTATLPATRPSVEAVRDDPPSPFFDAGGPAERSAARLDAPRPAPVGALPPVRPNAPLGAPAPSLGIRPFVPAASHEQGRQEAPPPAPVVEVTIGRIEIRAEVTAPKAARRATAPPVMTLDDYLRRREGVPRE